MYSPRIAFSTASISMRTISSRAGPISAARASASRGCLDARYSAMRRLISWGQRIRLRTGASTRPRSFASQHSPSPSLSSPTTPSHLPSSAPYSHIIPNPPSPHPPPSQSILDNSHGPHRQASRRLRDSEAPSPFVVELALRAHSASGSASNYARASSTCVLSTCG